MYDDACSCDVQSEHFLRSVTATPEGVRATLDEVMQFVAQSGATEQELGNIQLVLAEVLNNIVEHALVDVHDPLLELRMCRAGQDFHFLTKDNGCAMPNHQIPLREMPDVDVATQDLPEGGYGWAIFRLFAHGYSYQRACEMNFLRFSIKLS